MSEEELEERVEELEEKVETLSKLLESTVSVVDQIEGMQSLNTYMRLLEQGKLEDLREDFPDTIDSLEERAQEALNSEQE